MEIFDYKSENTLLQFTPEREIDPTEAPTAIKIKGASPLLVYSFSLFDLYQEVPSLESFHAYYRIREELRFVDEILHAKLQLRSGFSLPMLVNNNDALPLLGTLFNPRKNFSVTDSIPQVSHPAYSTEIFSLENPRPFSFDKASSTKLLHTLVWIDTNMKVNIEQIAALHHIPNPMTIAIVKAALTVYIVMIKMHDYRLARLLNFNHSMFLQDRILSLLFGEQLKYCERSESNPRYFGVSVLSNRISLALLKELTPVSHRELCRLSVFMGVVWTSLSEVQKAYLEAQDRTLSELDACLRTAMEHQFCIDHRDKFLEQIGKDAMSTILVILDDNGESVFDIALFQGLLRDTSNIKLIFILNRYPISNNIALDSFYALLADDFFHDMRRFLSSGRVSLCVEEQLFRSFEYSYLSPQTLLAISKADLAYIKGVNFFETFQLIGLTRYYCFTVSGVTSSLLTGCKEGSGIFARVEKGQEGYNYKGPDDVTTLRDVSFTQN